MGIRESDEKLETKLETNRKTRNREEIHLQHLHGSVINILCLFGVYRQNKLICGEPGCSFLSFLSLSMLNLCVGWTKQAIEGAEIQKNKLREDVEKQLGLKKEK
ncbi:hypothetical protein INR49_005858 [Caranx melampygus]|nr:hypothetical protein INR49_005858 [Caranx melampygus]